MQMTTSREAAKAVRAVPAKVFADDHGKTWEQYTQECTDRDLLSIIHSTNPKGSLRLARLAAMEEWDRRHPVAAEAR